MNGGGTRLGKKNIYCVPLCQERRDKKKKKSLFRENLCQGLCFFILL